MSMMMTIDHSPINLAREIAGIARRLVASTPETVPAPVSPTVSPAAPALARRRRIALARTFGVDCPGCHGIGCVDCEGLGLA